ncbi:hypothetical protein GW17_00055799 [Ensete ventricosum]|nr:hypothetical protein GW17_00055799 [Ensete ventricosum]
MHMDLVEAKISFSVRVLEPLWDSKIGVISIGDRPPWNSIGVLSSKLLLKGYRNYSSIHDEKWMITRLFIGLLTLTPNRTSTPRLLLLRTPNATPNTSLITTSNRPI